MSKLLMICNGWNMICNGKNLLKMICNRNLNRFLTTVDQENSSLDPSMIEQIDYAFKELGIIIEGDYSDIIQYRGRTSDRQWTIDPIDGTEGFRRGLAYAIGIGFLINHIPTFCAIAVPNFQDNFDGMFFAELNHGAFACIGTQKLTRIHVNSCQDISSAILVKSLHHDRPITSDLIATYNIQNVIPMDGMGKFCKVALGSADIYLRPFSNQSVYVWDYCPGHILIQEAGGQFTGLSGEIPQYQGMLCTLKSDGIIAANGYLQQQLLSFFKKKG